MYMIKSYYGDIVQRFNYNQELCNLCGVCVDKCDENALTIQDNILYFNPCKCRKCEGCDGECPNDAMSIEFFVINQREWTGEKHQDRYWEINSSCHISCDGITCNECGRNENYDPMPYDKKVETVKKQKTLEEWL